MLYEDNSLAYGNTPLVKINRISKGRIYAKIESRNPAMLDSCHLVACRSPTEEMAWEKAG